MGVPDWDKWPHDLDRPNAVATRGKKSWIKQDGSRLGQPRRPSQPLRPIRLPPPTPSSWRAPKRGLVAAFRRRLVSLAAIAAFVLIIQTLRRRNSSGGSPSTLSSEFPGKGPRTFLPGQLKGPGIPYSKMLVVPRTSVEDTSWITSNFDGSDSIQSTVYVVDDPAAPHRPPANKGHEVMVYLSYIIDHYHNLSDVTIFMHAHQLAWHNSELLDNDAVTMVRRLSAPRVVREGYVNLRCEWTPGCPAWLHPFSKHEDVNKKEEKDVAKVWGAVFPGEEVPEVLAQPCCAQFAVSRERIQALEMERYVRLRDWLLGTELSDYISGRVWEYMWQYLFTGQNVVCPAEHVCYCDGYGICFGGQEAYKEWWTNLYNKRHYQDEQRTLVEDILRLQAEFEYSRTDSEEEFVVPEEPQVRKKELEEIISKKSAWLVLERKAAFERGDIPANRAKEAGREWKDGDGF